MAVQRFLRSVSHWLATQELVLWQNHAPGEKLFVDYAGQTVPIVDRYSGETREAQVFVAVLGCLQHPVGRRQSRAHDNVRLRRAHRPLSRLKNRTYLDTTSLAIGYEADDDLASLTHTHTGGTLALTYQHNGVHQITQLGANDASYLAPQPSPTSSYTANNLNQYTQVASTTLTYDANGNLTSDGLWTYRYDEENRLRQALSGGTTVDYAYDPLGRRRSKSVNGTITYFMYDGPNELAELNSSGTRQRFYANGNGMDERVGMHEDVGGATGWHFFHTNHQGSVLYTTRPSVSGAHASFHYGAYGESQDSPTGNPMRYTGRYLDAETGLYYYRARYYSPRLGRFLQTDPIGIKDDLNLYAYVGGDPLNRLDPSGENAAIAVGVVVVGALIAGCAISESCTGSDFREAAERVAEEVIEPIADRLIDSALRRFGMFNKRKDKERPRNVDNPEETQESLTDAQGKSRARRPSREDATDDKGEENEWEGARSRPKARDIESTKRSDDRAKHRRKRDWRDHEDKDDPKKDSDELTKKER